MIIYAVDYKKPLVNLFGFNCESMKSNACKMITFRLKSFRVFFFPIINLWYQPIRGTGMRKVWESRDSLFHFIPSQHRCMSYMCVKKLKNKNKKWKRTENTKPPYGSYRTKLNSLFCYFKALWPPTQAYLLDFISHYIFSTYFLDRLKCLLGTTQALSFRSPPCSPPASMPVAPAKVTSVLLHVFESTHLSTSTFSFNLHGHPS